jgi:flagellar motility protein MotE (MotC chaperone)
MSKAVREFRLIPIVLIAVACLFVLKSMGIVLDGGYTLGQRLAGSETLVVTTVPAAATAPLRSPATTLQPSQASGSGKPWMRENFYPDLTGSVPSAPASKDEKKEKAAAAAPPPGPAPDAKSGGTKIALDAPPRAVSAAERALLERLQERRQELDARARELDVRESLLAAAEKKLESKTAEQKPSGGKSGGVGRKDDPDARFKGVVTMYETMKPKEAAKIFDRLDIRVLLEVASQINPRVMSAILAQMTPEAAERLTVELAAHGGPSEKSVNPSDLPKIEGKPSN